MKILWQIISNGFVPLIPILAWNLYFTAKLPAAYGPSTFDSNIPPVIVFGETIFRGIVFVMPLFFTLNIGSALGKVGLIIFSVGVAAYFSSWLSLIYFPQSFWSTHVLGFAAPAYTPIIWLVGLGLMADSYYFKLDYAKWHFILPAILFAIFHISHSVYVYNRHY